MYPTTMYKSSNPLEIGLYNTIYPTAQIKKVPQQPLQTCISPPRLFSQASLWLPHLPRTTASPSQHGTALSAPRCRARSVLSTPDPTFHRTFASPCGMEVPPSRLTTQQSRLAKVLKPYTSPSTHLRANVLCSQSLPRVQLRRNAGGAQGQRRDLRKQDSIEQLQDHMLSRLVHLEY